MLRSIVTVTLLALLGATAAAQPVAPPTLPARFPRAELARFAAGVARRGGLRRRSVLAVLERARPLPQVIATISRPPEQVLAWWQYRSIFLTPKRIAAGVAFWREHRAALARVSAEEGVAPQYIVAILGAETNYGRIMGTYRVLDALATLAFDYPPRSRFFRYQLEQFLVLAQRNKLDPLTVTGSYAGAMGPLQFMPSTYLRYAVDETGDGPINLFTNWDDIFASVASYLHRCGWQSGGPVVADVTLDPGAAFKIDPRNLDLDETIGELHAEGVKVDDDAPRDTRVVLLLAEQQDGPSYRVGFNNFHALTRYNDSALYAMAVNDLARAIARQYAESVQ